MDFKFFVSCTAVCLIFLSACEDMGDPVKPVIPPSNSPSISSIVPDSGVAGDTVTINGTNFGAVQGGSSISFGTISASAIVSWNNTQVVVVVPPNAVTANVTVTVGNSTSNAVHFSVIGSVAPVSFSGDIRPLITAYGCANCHGSSGGYSVATHASIVTRVTVGNGDGSLLVRKLRGQAGTRMPASGPPYMTPQEIQKFVDWINQGALNN